MNDELRQKIEDAKGELAANLIEPITPLNGEPQAISSNLEAGQTPTIEQPKSTKQPPAYRPKIKLLKIATLLLNVIVLIPLMAYFILTLAFQHVCQNQANGCGDLGLIFLPFAPLLAISWVAVLFLIILTITVIVFGKLGRKYMTFAVIALIIAFTIEGLYLFGTKQAVHDANLSQAEAVSLIESCQIGYVYPAHYTKDVGTDDSSIQLWTVNQNGVTLGLKHTSNQNWEAVKQAVLAVQNKCQHITAPGILDGAQ